MLLQVHDELVFDAHKDEVEMIKPIIIDCMQTALILPNGVPAEVSPSRWFPPRGSAWWQRRPAALPTPNEPWLHVEIARAQAQGEGPEDVGGPEGKAGHAVERLARDA